MMKNKNARAGEARATGGAKTRRGQANAVFTRDFTTRDELRQLANFAARRASMSAHPQKRKRFARLALFLKVFAARGGLR